LNKIQARSACRLINVVRTRNIFALRLVEARPVLTGDLSHVFASVTHKILVTGALEGGQQVCASAVVEARAGLALIDVKFAPADLQIKKFKISPTSWLIFGHSRNARVTRHALTRVAVDVVEAGGAVEAVVGQALVNVLLALEPLEAGQARALVGLVRVATRAAVLALVIKAQNASLGRLLRRGRRHPMPRFVTHAHLRKKIWF
jgi:hypothetical protein